MIRRGDILIVSLDPAVGSEAAKTRPVVVVSNDAANRSSQCEQVRAISILRIVRSAGRLRAETLAQVDDALRVHLAL
jgi:mRNA interferase MazF